MVKVVDIKTLEYYDQCLKKYINMKIGLNVNKSTHCPNCGALITSSKCGYCGTDFEASAIWGDKLEEIK